MSPEIVEGLRAAWVVYGPIGVIVVLLLIALVLGFRHFGTKWMESKFGERLEAYKHAQQREMEALRFKINGLFDRASKVHGKEFEFLPIVWFQVNAAMQAARPLTGIARWIPALDGLSEDKLERYLAASDLTEDEKHDIRSSDSKSATYGSIGNYRLLNAAKKENFTLRGDIAKYAIFFHEDIKLKCEEILDLMWKAIVEYEVYSLDGHEVGVDVVRSARKRLDENGNDLLQDLESTIRARLWNAEQERL